MYYHTSFEDLVLNGASVAFISQICVVTDRRKLKCKRFGRSTVTISFPEFVRIGQLIQNLKRRDTQRHIGSMELKL